MGDNMTITKASILSQVQIDALTAMGAVIIPDLERWEQYKKESFPLERWKDFKGQAGG